MDAELIIILVAVGLSILSGFNKARKKKEEAGQNSPAPGNPREEEDPWATIRKYIEDAQNDQSPQPANIDRQVKKPKPAPAEKNPYTDKLNQYAASKSARDKNRKNSNRGGEVETVSGITVESNDFMDDFDLEKAVIYSEILHPKYEEI